MKGRSLRPLIQYAVGMLLLLTGVWLLLGIKIFAVALIGLGFMLAWNVRDSDRGKPRG